jgi:hypothetical protein
LETIGLDEQTLRNDSGRRLRHYSCHCGCRCRGVGCRDCQCRLWDRLSVGRDRCALSSVVVGGLVLLQLTFVPITSRAHCTDKRLFSRVDPDVCYKSLASQKSLATSVASEKAKKSIRLRSNQATSNLTCMAGPRYVF